MSEEDKNEKVPEEISSEREIEGILKLLMDAPGYILFVGVLDKKRDSNGRNLINYRYKRYQFSLEDARRSIDKFIEHYRKDLKSLD